MHQAGLLYYCPETQEVSWDLKPAGKKVWVFRVPDTLWDYCELPEFLVLAKKLLTREGEGVVIGNKELLELKRSKWRILCAREQVFFTVEELSNHFRGNQKISYGTFSFSGLEGAFQVKNSKPMRELVRRLYYLTPDKVV